MRLLVLSKLYCLLITYLKGWNGRKYFFSWLPYFGFCVSYKNTPKNGKIWCSKYRNVWKIWGIKAILDKIGVKLCKNLHCLKDILISFHIFISWKNLVWFLSYVILNFIMSGFPLKIFNLTFWIDIYRKSV